MVEDEGPDPIDVHVGKRLREHRLQAGLTQREVAEWLGVGFQAVQKYENGLIRISASTLYRLGWLLGVEPNDFFEGYAGPLALWSKKQKRRTTPT